MSRHLLSSLCFSLLLAASLAGCTGYGEAVDRRTLGTQLDDRAITTAVQKQLVENDRTSFASTNTYTFDGHVYLIGTYKFAEQPDLARQEARTVEGVRSVTVYMLSEQEVEAQTCDRWESGIEASTYKRLAEDEIVKAGRIEIDPIGCHVVLLGLVGSSTEKARAEEIARRVEGVTSVKSFLMVR